MTRHPDDRMIYFVRAVSKSGEAWVEREPGDMDRAMTIKRIASGEWENVIQVLECNPVENVCNDVTEDILAAAFPDAPEIVPDAAERQAWAFDHAQDSRKHSEVV